MRLINNFDGTVGVTITASNSGAGGTPFDIVDNLGNGAVCVFADANSLGRATAAQVMQISTGTQASSSCVGYTSSLGTLTEFWSRWYMYQTSQPTLETRQPMFFQAYSGSTELAAIGQIDQSPAYYPTIETPSIEGFISTVIPVNQWTRWEAHMVLSTTSGLAELRYFSGANVDGEIPSHTKTLNGDMGGNSADKFLLGATRNRKNVFTTYFSGWEINNEGWPGPAPFRPGKGVPGVLTNPIAIHTDSW